eukprot:TRINITY_DN13007_c0_g1_i1.p2 TRINITY_DN13007_c0_g1~~TRINITY_DN13007_c0_g1_i1.p2  ORF type:complete len:186 (-),score=30.22 TRINITY_DN13007_c0_g1_i1:344-901(-)
MPVLSKACSPELARQQSRGYNAGDAVSLLASSPSPASVPGTTVGDLRGAALRLSSPPAPASVPMPNFCTSVKCPCLWRSTVATKQRSPQAKKALRQAVQALLSEAAQVLLKVPQRSLAVAELYLSLPSHSTAFMHKQTIWLSDVLECYLNDFDTFHDNGRLMVTYLHPTVPACFRISLVSRLVSL